VSSVFPSDSLSLMIDEFVIYWRDYQESWTQVVWRIYEELRQEDNSEVDVYLLDYSYELRA
jgi:hypothetical protein